MRWARFEGTGGARYALVEGDRLAEVEGTPFGDYRATGVRVPLAEARLLPPVEPRNFFAVGYNYEGHTKEAEGFLAKPPKRPERPNAGFRYPSSLTGSGADIVLPPDTSVVQFEGELVAVIGRGGKNLSEDEIAGHILGYTIGNDVSERVWQKEDVTLWRAKCADTFCPMGPWIDTEARPEDMTTVIRLNGEEVSRFATNGMIFGVARYLSEISRYIALAPGDMIWMGAEAPSLDMRAGDRVEVEIDSIGVLSNRVVAGRD